MLKHVEAVGQVALQLLHFDSATPFSICQEPAPFTRILLKGKGKGDDGGRRGGGAATPQDPNIRPTEMLQLLIAMTFFLNYHL